MHVFIKRLLFLLGIVLVLLLASFIYHRLALQREKASLNPMGQMVSVNGHDMSVFVKGEGPQTLVFLSGAGTASPILDFKDLYDGLSKQYISHESVPSPFSALLMHPLNICACSYFPQIWY